MSIYLGLDSSTQSVTATAVDIDDAQPDRRDILFERTFRYDEALPRYGTEHGVLRSADPRTVHAPPLMWSEALDRMLADLEVGETPAGVASAVEFVLEGLHLSKRLNKDSVGGKDAYRGRG